ELEPVAVDARCFRIGWRFPPVVQVRGEVTVEDRERISRVRVLIESGRQEHMGAEVHRCSIELSEQVALDTNMLDVLGVFRWLDRWNHLVELDSDDVGAVRVDFDSLRRAVEIARFAVPLLTLTPVGRQLDGVTGREIEGLVSVQYRLRPVFPGRQLSRR